MDNFIVSASIVGFYAPYMDRVKKVIKHYAMKAYEGMDV
jgi:hypothetical protein